MDSRRRALLAAALGTAASARFARAFAQDNVNLTKIGLGTWQTFDAGNDSAARTPLREVVRIFAAAGHGVVDSSPMYGSSESVAGDLIAEVGVRERLFIATKVWTSGREDGIAQMEMSFRRLRVEVMDLMQVHNLVDVATQTKTLQEWKQQGRVRHIGITHYTSSAYAEVERWMKTGAYEFVQINYSLAERDAERRILPLAADRKMHVIINRPFAGSALFRQTRGKPLPSWAAELGIASWAQYFLKWIVSHPAVTCAIPGTGRPEHMRDNLGAAKGPFPDSAARKRMADYLENL